MGIVVPLLQCLNLSNITVSKIRFLEKKMTISSFTATCV